jgi:hypothetical protein
MSALKALAKPFAAARARRRAIRRAGDLFQNGEHSFKGLAIDQIFEKIYADAIWGRHPDGMPWSGSGTHTPGVAEPYVEAVGAFLARLGTDVTVVDLGCGDFHIGSKIAPFAARYIACDVAASIIESNIDRWPFEHVEFRTLDLAADALPAGNVGFVRQVLQHLGNDDIKSFVKNLNRTKPYDHLIVTEHVPATEGFAPNVDMPSGSWIRVEFGSGVVLEKPPFNLRHLSSEILCAVDQPAYGEEAIIRTIHYRLK